MPYTQSEAALNKAVMGVDNANPTVESTQFWQQLLAFHVWLRLQNSDQVQNKKDITLNGVDKYKAAQAAIRLIRWVQLEAAISEQGTTFNIIDTKSAPEVAELNKFIKADAHDLNGQFGVLENSSYFGCANLLLEDLDRYLNANNNKLVENDEQNKKLKDQIKLLQDSHVAAQNAPTEVKPDASSSPVQRGTNFVLRASLFTLFFPWSWLLAGVMGGVYSLKFPALKDLTQTRPYAARVNADSMLGRMGQGFANMFLALIFEPFRYVFSYDDWDDESKKRFNNAEETVSKAAFALFAVPFAVILGLFAGLYQTLKETFQNWAEIWGATSEQDLKALVDDDNRKPYGLGLLRGFLWLKDSIKTVWGKTPVPLKYFLGLVFWPITVLYGLSVLFPISEATQAKLVAVFSWIFLPADVAAGLIAKGIKEVFPNFMTNAREKTLHKWFCIAEFSFLMGSLGPILWGGLIATAWAPIIKILTGSHLGTFTDIFWSIWNTPGVGGAWAKALWFGANGSPGLFTLGAEGFASGMKAMGFGLKDFALSLGSAQTWINIGQSIGHFFQSIPTALPGLSGAAFAWMGRSFAIVLGAVTGYQVYKHYKDNENRQVNEKKAWSLTQIFAAIIPGVSTRTEKSGVELQAEVDAKITGIKQDYLKKLTSKDLGNEAPTASISLATQNNNNNKGDSNQSENTDLGAGHSSSVTGRGVYNLAPNSQHNSSSYISEPPPTAGGNAVRKSNKKK